MPIRLLCPNCRQPLTIADHLAGKRINCPKCKNLVQVPAPDGAPAPAAPPAHAAPQGSAEDDLQLNIPGQDHTRHAETVQHKRCPGCGRDVPESTVLCTGCGHDFKTGQRRKGFEMVDPEKRKRIFDSVIRNGFFVIILLVAVAGIYYAYKKGLFNPSTPQPEEKKEEEQPAVKKPEAKPAAKPEDNKNSLIAVTNDRFSKVAVFVDGERAGEVAYRQMGKFQVAPPSQGKSATISFEASLPIGHKLPEAISTVMTKGVPFSGTTKQGMQVVIAGPTFDMAPAADEIMTNVLVDLEVIKDPTLNVGLMSSLKYKGCLIKPVPPQTKLHLAYGKTDTKTVVKWIVQEVLVERNGLKAYEPAAVPFEATTIDLVFKDGVLDVKR